MLAGSGNPRIWREGVSATASIASILFEGGHSAHPPPVSHQHHHHHPEMEKRADTADISVLFFFGYANFLQPNQLCKKAPPSLDRLQKGSVVE